MVRLLFGRMSANHASLFSLVTKLSDIVQLSMVSLQLFSSSFHLPLPCADARCLGLWNTSYRSVAKFGWKGQPMTRKRAAKNGSSTADEARSINASLRRTQVLLQQELERVTNVTEAIDVDGKLLNQTKSHQHNMNDTVRGANAALRNLKLQQRKEFLVLMASILCFYGAAAYVLSTRIVIPFIPLRFLARAVQVANQGIMDTFANGV